MTGTPLTRAERTIALAGLSHHGDEALDRLTRVVQRQLDVPISLVSLVTADRQVFPGLAGLGGWAGSGRQTPLTHSFCQHVVQRSAPLVVSDARTDPLVRANLATTELGVVAYLGIPLTIDGSTVLGSLCAIDTLPREWTTAEIEALTDLAALCSNEIAGRLDQTARAELFAAAVPLRQDDRLGAVLHSVPIVLGYWDRDLRNVVANRAFQDWFGLSATQIPGRHIREVIGEELFAQSEVHLVAALAGEARDVAWTVRGPDGTIRHARASHLPDTAADGSVVGVFTHLTDVTELTESVAFHDAVLAATPDLVYELDLPTRTLVWASRSFVEVLGYTPADLEALGDELYAALVHPDDLYLLAEANDAAARLTDGETLEVRVRARHASGEYRWFLRRITPFDRNPDGTVRRVLGFASDIHESVQLTERLQTAALHDDLTGLPNRQLFLDRLELALNRQARGTGRVPVLYCDLDGFKHVNDTGGHDAGDAVLVTVAERLSGLMRSQDTVARLSGDEFVIVMEPDPDPTSTADAEIRAALAIADRIASVVSAPITVDGRQHFVTASVGIALAAAGDRLDDVLRNADAAMYQAKRRGKARAELFETTLRHHADEHARIETALRAGLSTMPGEGDHPIRVDYQPIYDPQSGRMVGVEALARLHDAHLVSIPPAQFIPVAEETGLIAGLGRLVLSTACQDLGDWRRAHPHAEEFGVAVNLSAHQAGLSDLVHDVDAALAAAGVGAEWLTLELTESALLEAGRSTMTALRDLRSRGVQIAIDDFGTGYASLRYLTELPVTQVKIDKSFTAGTPTDPVRTSIVLAVSSLARDLTIDCVVEGVETDEQFAALPAGVLAQGYLLGRPMPAHAIGRLLTERADRAGDSPAPRRSRVS